MYEYKCKIIKVVDGDTVDVDLDLGFGVWLNNERVRIMGIDTPESRTSDKIEKIFGQAAKDSAMAITPDFNNSALTFGPTFSTLLKLKDPPIEDVNSFLIISIAFALVSFFSILIKKSFSLPNFLTLKSPKFILLNELLNEVTLIFLSSDLNSIRVPPLKSTPKLRPLKNNNRMDIITRLKDIRLNSL